ncbi:MAG: hypothetical protein RL681_139 [Candidatus Parcubacteria bacterium]|jgi:prepilin-type N-terminal cleavage/methylation domain-containing protein
MYNRIRGAAAGFTLIELLIVIGIIVILSVVVILTLNPAQLLAQSRDSRRVSDLAALQSAISLYLADATSPSIVSSSSPWRCYYNGSGFPAGGANACGGRFSNSQTSHASTTLGVSGGGWVPIDFTVVSSGAPLSNLPVDPVNDSTHFMAYTGSSSLVYEINVSLESTKYTTGAGSLLISDGGSSSTLYEVGTKSGLDL